MNRVARQIDTFSRKHDSQLPPPPVGVTQPHLYDALFCSCARALRAAMRPSAALGNPLHTLPLKPPQPQISGGSRDAQFIAQRTERLRLPRRCDYKLNALLMNIHSSPRHPRSPPARKSRRRVKDVPGQSVKDVMGLNTLRLRVLTFRGTWLQNINSNQTTFALVIKTPTTPWPIFRMFHQVSIHRIPVHVVQLFQQFLLIPHIEVRKSSLAKRSSRLSVGIKHKFPLTSRSPTLEQRSHFRSKLGNLAGITSVSNGWPQPLCGQSNVSESPHEFP